jgi:hypothetical protein
MHVIPALGTPRQDCNSEGEEEEEGKEGGRGKGGQRRREEKEAVLKTICNINIFQQKLKADDSS